MIEWHDDRDEPWCVVPEDMPALEVVHAIIEHNNERNVECCQIVVGCGLFSKLINEAEPTCCVPSADDCHFLHIEGVDVVLDSTLGEGLVLTCGYEP